MSSGASRETQQPGSIIVLTREHIGDLVCTTPALRSLRELFPKAKIVVEVGERAACVLQGNPHVDEVIIRKDHQGIAGRIGFLRELRSRHFDLGVVFDDSTDMPLTLWLGGARRRAGLDRKSRWVHLLTDVAHYNPNTHEMVDNFRYVAATLGADITNAKPELFPSSNDIALANDVLREHDLLDGKPIIGLNPGASAPSNRWPPNRFAELIGKLTALKDYHIVLMGGPQDSAVAEDIRAATTTPIPVLTGRFTVLELTAALQHFRLLVTGDTGPMHIACATGTPTLALFGPALPSESGPLYVPGNRVIRKVAGCPGCTKYNCTRQQECMLAISADEVYSAACDMLANKTEER